MRKRFHASYGISKVLRRSFFSRFRMGATYNKQRLWWITVSSLPCIPTTLSLDMGTSEPETHVSKRTWRNIGEANTAINGKRGGGGGYHRISKVKLWSPKVRKLFEKKVLAEAKCVWLNQLSVFTKGNSKMWSLLFKYFYKLWKINHYFLLFGQF